MSAPAAVSPARLLRGLATGLAVAVLGLALVAGLADTTYAPEAGARLAPVLAASRGLPPYPVLEQGPQVGAPGLPMALVAYLPAAATGRLHRALPLAGLTGFLLVMLAAGLWIRTVGSPTPQVWAPCLGAFLAVGFLCGALAEGLLGIAPEAPGFCLGVVALLVRDGSSRGRGLSALASAAAVWAAPPMLAVPLGVALTEHRGEGRKRAIRTLAEFLAATAGLGLLAGWLLPSALGDHLALVAAGSFDLGRLAELGRPDLAWPLLVAALAGSRAPPESRVHPLQRSALPVTVLALGSGLVAVAFGSPASALAPGLWWLLVVTLGGLACRSEAQAPEVRRPARFAGLLSLVLVGAMARGEPPWERLAAVQFRASQILDLLGHHPGKLWVPSGVHFHLFAGGPVPHSTQAMVARAAAGRPMGEAQFRAGVPPELEGVLVLTKEDRLVAERLPGFEARLGLPWFGGPALVRPGGIPPSLRFVPHVHE